MKAFAGLAAATLAAVTAFAVLPEADRVEAGSATPLAHVEEDYSLRMPGIEAECALAKEAATARGVSELRLAPACSRVYPAMARVRYWSEEADGSVAFLSDAGETLIRFGVADGPGYESFEPASANLTLAAIAH